MLNNNNGHIEYLQFCEPIPNRANPYLVSKSTAEQLLNSVNTKLLISTALQSTGFNKTIAPYQVSTRHTMMTISKIFKKHFRALASYSYFRQIYLTYLLILVALPA